MTVGIAKLDYMEPLDWRWIPTFFYRLFSLMYSQLVLMHGYLRGITEYFLGYISHGIILDSIMFPNAQKHQSFAALLHRNSSIIHLQSRHCISNFVSDLEVMEGKKKKKKGRGLPSST